jgi:hypothetical protein
MLVADAGSAEFDRSFKQLIAAVLPDLPLVDIPDDDGLYEMPYKFPNGAPPLWHHGGNRALGVRHKGRWCVFYHPGDMNDAWKTSNAEPEKAAASSRMGINIIYYAFTQYLQQTKKYRK